jgi:hypothetical protein
MISYNDKPKTYSISRTFGAWRITFYNANGRATDAIEMRGTKASAAEAAQRIIEMNA